MEEEEKKKAEKEVKEREEAIRNADRFCFVLFCFVFYFCFLFLFCFCFLFCITLFFPHPFPIISILINLEENGSLLPLSPPPPKVNQLENTSQMQEEGEGEKEGQGRRGSLSWGRWGSIKERRERRA